MAAGAALAAKEGERASPSMYESMSEEVLKELAGTKRKNLPVAVYSPVEFG